MGVPLISGIAHLSSMEKSFQRTYKNWKNQQLQLNFLLALTSTNNTVFFFYKIYLLSKNKVITTLDISPNQYLQNYNWYLEHCPVCKIVEWSW